MDARFSIPSAYRWGLTLAFAAFIVGVSVTPGVAQPDDSVFSWLYANTAPLAQKFLHVVTYAALSILFLWTLASIKSVPARIAVSVSLAIGLGIGLEWYQTAVPGRYGTIADILLNSLGVAVGVVLRCVYGRIAKKV